METPRKLKSQLILSILTFGLGILLLLFMIFVEDEPGMVPLVLLAIGSVWFWITHSRIHALK
jgi:hypothetical protein